MTFFPWPGARSGRQGTGQVAVTAFAVLPRALGFWVERFVRHGVTFEGPTRQVISFKDHDGLMLQLVGHAGAEARPAWGEAPGIPREHAIQDRKSTRLNSSHTVISYAVFCLKKKK